MAFDNGPAGSPAKSPISLHPAFPAVVALWFAALLGVGSMVLPVILLERAVEASGLAGLVPAATPPLGFTARGLIAAAAALLGASLGAVIARRVASAHTPPVPARFSAASESRRPISVRDELGTESLGESNGTRRRSLAIVEEERASDFLLLAPLPGEDIPAEPAPIEEDAAADDTLELSDLADEPPLADFAEIDPVPAQEPAMTDEPPAQFPTADELERRRSERRVDATPKAPGGIERRLYLRRSDDDPLPFVAPSLARRAPDNENNSPDTVEVRLQFAPPAEFASPQPMDDALPEETRAEEENLWDEPEVIAEASAQEDMVMADEPTISTPDARDWENAPLERLGMVQLVQRLGASLEKRREQVASPVVQPPEAVEPPAPVATLDPFESAAAEEAAQAMAAYFGRPGPAEPAREVDVTPSAPAGPVFDPFLDEPEDADDDFAARFTLPLGRLPATEWELDDNADEDEDDDDAEDEQGGAFGSLIGLHQPVEATPEEFVRIEEPAETEAEVRPTVVFPGQDPDPAAGGASRLFDPPSASEDGVAASPAPASPPADADEALRKALATLQRMSSNG